MKPQDTFEYSELQLALQTAAAELNYERSKHNVESVAKEEDIRKLRFQLLLLEDENDELHAQLGEEEAHADGLQLNLDETLGALEEVKAEKQRVVSELRMRARELDTIKAEVMSLQNMSLDSTKILTEKLALARELGTLKPELEYLRQQTTSNQSLLSEKLSLQRQLSTIQVELENEKRVSQRALAKDKDRRVSAVDAEYRLQMQELRAELSKERREREIAEGAIDKAHAELERERRRAERVAARNEKNTEQDAKQEAEIEELREELAKERRERKKAEKTAQTTQHELELENQRLERELLKKQKVNDTGSASEAQLEALRKELKAEKLSREKAEKGVQKSQMEWETQKSILDEKLNNFRTKLKTTKEKLKETENELQSAQAAAAANNANPAKNPRKRAAAPLDPDATIGTPGDGRPAKRGKQSSAVPGDKSTFSITPFLNRTTSVAPDSPIQEEDEDEADAVQTEDQDPAEAAEAASTPSAQPKKAVKKPAAPKPRSKPLATSSAGKANTKTTAGRKKTAVPTLEQVAEEDSADENSAPAAPTTVPLNDTAEASKPLVPKLKPTSMNGPRKSLASFATFNAEPPAEKKKKRKLGGGSGLGKTLFDDDEGAPPAKPIPGKGLFAARSLGKALGAGRIGGGFNGGMVSTEDGFMFSPLKKDRRAAAANASMLK
ncbi:hypothetical protein H2201_002014 [Coniosporium apollinis]|uniref:Uncharacterized protein n=1 Tax=Coniosporium apollinis TaxID=61459 RepID=A0ABQ9P0N6_9PEZI|nr:hypothetical protein H2201_002014 [Coniosporium apollinis]